MKSSVRSLGVVLLLAIVLGAAWWFYQDQVPVPEEPVETFEIKEVSHHEDWISFTHPSVLSVPFLDLDLELLEQVDELSVTWTHAGLDDGEEFQLQKFVPQSRKAQYRIHADFGNLVPGKNHYLLKAKRITREGNLEKVKEFETEFDLDFDLSALEAFRSENIQLVDFPQSTDTNELDFFGTLTSPAESMRAFSYHPKSGMGTFTAMNRYEAGSLNFDYFAKESYNNLQSGENVYVFEAYDTDEQLLSRARFSLESSRLTLAEEVQKKFGNFDKVRGGWYQSSLLPWFLFRPVYEDVVYQAEEGMVTFARPTLLYTAESYKDVKLCDYLSETNYESDDVIFRGFSYETCQEYSRGVMVYDRAVSALTWEAAMTIPVDEYKDVADETTSAFVMIETIGMENQPVSLSSDVLTESPAFVEETPADDEGVKEPQYFVVQMLITQNAEYDGELVGDIEQELDEAQKAEFSEIKEMLSAHPAELLFESFLQKD